MPRSKQEKIKKIINRPPRFHNGAYEKRALIDGVNIYACSAEIDKCEELFLVNLVSQLTTPNKKEEKRPSGSMLFTDWAELWFHDVFQPNVTKTTFDNEFYRYKKHIYPFFQKKRLREISPLDCVHFFTQMREKGVERTTESCYGIMNRIFHFAVESNMIGKNPMTTIKPIKHERRNGVPLSKEEEKRFLNAIHGSRYEAALVLALYTGLRPCEYASAKIEGDFIIAQNRKQKNVSKIVYKKIPITPMLQPYVSLIEEKASEWELYIKTGKENDNFTFRKFCPNHRLYDLRTTFATRTQECGVPEAVVQAWMGHKSKTLLGQVYTHFSDDYFLLESKKVRY